MTREDFYDGLRNAADTLERLAGHIERVAAGAPDEVVAYDTLAVTDDLSAAMRRLRSVVARNATFEQQSPRPALGTVAVGPLLIDQATRCVTVGGEEVRMQRRLYDLLSMLASDPTRVFSREDLYESVWGRNRSAAQHTRTIDSAAGHLRRALADAGFHGVLNIWGVGYQLVAPELGAQDYSRPMAAVAA